jgi:hypothetical protein
VSEINKKFLRKFRGSRGAVFSKSAPLDPLENFCLSMIESKFIVENKTNH